MFLKKQEKDRNVQLVLVDSNEALLNEIRKVRVNVNQSITV